MLPRVVTEVPASVHRVGEPVEVTVTLENVGTESFYIPKEFSDGGLPGFEIRLGRRGEPYCFVNADFACSSNVQRALKKKDVKQLLNDYFLLLPPGGLVGIHTRLPTACNLAPGLAPLAPGKYEVTAVYLGSDVCVPDISKRNTKFPVLQSTVEAAPVSIELTE
jgi:hypothetical protein